mgnify:CR=1 FL=1
MSKVATWGGFFKSAGDARIVAAETGVWRGADTEGGAVPGTDGGGARRGRSGGKFVNRIVQNKNESPGLAMPWPRGGAGRKLRVCAARKVRGVSGCRA